jgi:hypothetical protein
MTCLINLFRWLRYHDLKAVRQYRDQWLEKQW